MRKYLVSFSFKAFVMNFVFRLEQTFDFTVNPCWIAIIKCNRFIKNEISHNVKDLFSYLIHLLFPPE